MIEEKCGRTDDHVGHDDGEIRCPGHAQQEVAAVQPCNEREPHAAHPWMVVDGSYAIVCEGIPDAPIAE